MANKHLQKAKCSTTSMLVSLWSLKRPNSLDLKDAGSRSFERNRFMKWDNQKANLYKCQNQPKPEDPNNQITQGI